jgi:DUF2938 family protein
VPLFLQASFLTLRIANIGGEMTTHTVLLAALVGFLTTATSDVGSLIGSRLGVGGPGPRTGGPDIIGRWFGYMLRGRFSHASIVQEPRLSGELPIGLAVHYLIGIIFTITFGVLVLALHLTSTILPAIAFGLATVVFPWFLMLPSQGLGIMGRNVPPPAHVARMSLYTHLVFGLALAVWTTVLRPF